MAANLDAEFRGVAQELTDLFKAEIRRQNLIDTGLMLATTRFEIVKSFGEYHFQLISTEYFEYVDNNFDVTHNVLNSQAYKQLLVRIGQLYAAVIVDEITTK